MTSVMHKVTSYLSTAGQHWGAMRSAKLRRKFRLCSNRFCFWGIRGLGAVASALAIIPSLSAATLTVPANTQQTVATGESSYDNFSVGENAKLIVPSGALVHQTGTGCFTAGENATLEIQQGGVLTASNLTGSVGFGISKPRGQLIVDGGQLHLSCKNGNVTPLFFPYSLTETSDSLVSLRNGAFVQNNSDNWPRPYISGTRNRMEVLNGATLNLLCNHMNMGFRFNNAQGCETMVSNANFKALAISFGNVMHCHNAGGNPAYLGDNYNKPAIRNVLRFHDAKVSWIDDSYSSLNFGCTNTAKVANQSYSNTVEVTGTLATTNDFRRIFMDGRFDTFRIDGPAVWASKEALLAGGTSNLVELLSGSYNNTIQLFGTGNAFRMTGGAFTRPIHIDGRGSRVEITGGTLSGDDGDGCVNFHRTARDATFVISGGMFTKTMYPGYTGVTYRITGGKIPTMTTDKARSDRVFICPDYQLDGPQQLNFGGANNLYEVSGASVVTGGVKVSGSNNRFVLRNGATHQSETMLDGLVFSDYTTNCTLVVDDATFVCHGAFGKEYVSQGRGGWAFSNLVNCAIEVRGKAPHFKVNHNDLGGHWDKGQAWGLWYTGTSRVPTKDSTELRFRFVIPKDGWKEAPFDVNKPGCADDPQEYTENGCVMQSNTVFEVVLEDELKNSAHGRMRVPLFRTHQGWSSRIDGSSGFDSAWCGIEKLNETARLFNGLPEGVTLGYDKSTHLIYADIRSTQGMAIIFR